MRAQAGSPRILREDAPEERDLSGELVRELTRKGNLGEVLLGQGAGSKRTMSCKVLERLSPSRRTFPDSDKRS